MISGGRPFSRRGHAVQHITRRSRPGLNKRKVRPNHNFPAPAIEQRQTLAPGIHVVSLAGLVRMKLTAGRDQDRLHLRDMIDVGLIGRELLEQLPPELSVRLDALLTESGR